MNNDHKYYVVGFHASGKQEIASDLIKNGVKVGKNFISLADIPSDLYILNSEQYSMQDINVMFENQAYVFLDKKTLKDEVYYEGLSLYEYDNNDVFFMTPDQFNLIPQVPENVCIIWLDNNVADRKSRFMMERRKYNFITEENAEKKDIAEFIDKIISNNPLYFNNEEPLRVSSIIYALVKHSDLLPIFKERFK